MEKLSINRAKAVQENFLGMNGVYHGYAGLPDKAGRVYSDELCELEADRAKEIGMKVVRTYYKWYAWTREDGWNWENETMTAFYKWCERMQKRGIDIALHGGWCSPGDVLGNSWGGDCPFADGGVSFEEAADNLAAWVSESLHQLIEVRGFTNIKYLMLFTEPATASGKLPEGHTPFTVWETASRAIHNRLVRDGRRNLVKLVGPNENARACNYPELLKYAAEHASDFLDSFSCHIYARFEMEDRGGVHSGNRSVFFAKPGQRIGQAITLKPHTKYTVSAFVHVIAEDYLHMSGNVLLGAFLPSENVKGPNVVGSFTAGGEPTTRLTQNSVKMVDPAIYGDNWFEIVHTFETEDITDCIIGLFSDIKTDAMVYADDFSLIEYGTTENLLINPSFEEEDGIWWGAFSTPVAYDIYDDWKLWAKTMIDIIPEGKNLWYDEYNSVFDYYKRFTDPWHGTRIAMANIGMMNAGAENTLIWAAFDQQWPNNHTNNDDSFKDGVQYVGMMPVLTQSFKPYPDYYAFQIMSRYLGGEGTKVYAEKDGAVRLHLTLTEQPDGTVTLAIVNLRNEDADFEVDLGKDCDEPMYRHLFSPETVKPDETATMISADKTVVSKNGKFCDTIPAGGVAVYTTKKD